MDITLKPASVSGTISVPASKSQTIRALLIALFASGRSIIHHPLYSSDTKSALQACRVLGAEVTDDPDCITITPPAQFPSCVAIDCANSGTTLYLLCAMLSATGVKATFTGDEQLKKRPVGPLTDALESLGVNVTFERVEGYPPFTVQGPLHGGELTMHCHTSQYLSGIILASVMSSQPVHIQVPLLNEIPYVYMTIDWLKRQNQMISYTDDLSAITVQGGGRYSPFETVIAGDFSSASFFFCAAAVAHSSVSVEGLDRNDPQGDKEVLAILEKMGCTVSWEAGSVNVALSEKDTLRGGEFDLNAIPDALPVLAVTAAFAHGTTVLGNVPQARIKETDRIATMRANLERLGAKVEEREDALVIHGSGRISGGTVDGYDDHRIIMAMAIASLAAEEQITIRGIDAVDVTFPTFFSLLEKISKEK